MTHALYELLSDLDDRHLFYTLGRHRPDIILISITVPGERIEIDVFDDGHMEISRFSGDERFRVTALAYGKQLRKAAAGQKGTVDATT
ncbi:hypothetical protein [Burkholderia cepacia]|uniref:hypothetical protein n=1 Tax=Burkholderia cepacia TaxID=292 RepID=UPI000F5AB570|nr:hypothetical protein [Burkholderia cepacia]RQT80598.1 hypothetical protein DF041_37900 [Burkholderia cepacia]